MLREPASVLARFSYGYTFRNSITAGGGIAFTKTDKLWPDAVHELRPYQEICWKKQFPDRWVQLRIRQEERYFRNAPQAEQADCYFNLRHRFAISCSHRLMHLLPKKQKGELSLILASELFINSINGYWLDQSRFIGRPLRNAQPASRNSTVVQPAAKPRSRFNRVKMQTGDMVDPSGIPWKEKKTFMTREMTKISTHPDADKESQPTC